MSQPTISIVECRGPGPHEEHIWYDGDFVGWCPGKGPEADDATIDLPTFLLARAGEHEAEADRLDAESGDTELRAELVTLLRNTAATIRRVVEDCRTGHIAFFGATKVLQHLALNYRDDADYDPSWQL